MISAALAALGKFFGGFLPMPDTTHIYAEVDMEMKAKALASVDIGGLKGPPKQRVLPSLMAFLKAL